MFKWLNTFFGPRKNFVEVKFYLDAKPHGRHGSIHVTNKRLGLIEQEVDFVFVGITTPPVLSERTFYDILDAASKQGYIVHHLGTYWERNDLHIPKDTFAEIDSKVISMYPSIRQFTTPTEHNRAGVARPVKTHVSPAR